ncbi:hypothetical protein BKA82DRAFT_1008994 [Pisolithus tinctorius]|nr:hypothetical protein BKA82DRAFT_1008994 [Pisolithus tinctorius]
MNSLKNATYTYPVCTEPQLPSQWHLSQNSALRLAEIVDSLSKGIFFAPVERPTAILSSRLVSRLDSTEVMQGSYDFVHILNLDTSQSDRSFHFVLHFPIDFDTTFRWQMWSAVGCPRSQHTHSGYLRS